MAEPSAAERRRNSHKAEIVAPPRGFRLPRPIRRLQRQAPMYALQGLGSLSTRLRELTGHDVIDMNRVMEVVQFIYQQRRLAQRGSNYVVDDFGFDPEWTQTFLTVFKSLLRDYCQVRALSGRDGLNHGAASH